jgi:L-seryl-tRNA(Ser) seleniumtransferase
VINATGVILHTNLGRAPLAAAALERAREIGSGYSNLEFDLASGERGKRDAHADRLFSRLFSQQLGAGAEQLATIVVNNNAAAVLLALNTIAEAGEVVVSRGELVEIGGAFRVPEVMAKAGSQLREVGTTNRTRIGDYERALNEKTRALLRVHRSNFQMVGFTEQPSLAELVELGRKRNIPVIEDLGSGALFDMQSLGISGEPGVSESLRAGVDVVTYSGDKLLGGPQAGLISGRKDLLARLRSNPLFRAVRVDKLTYAALEATLLAYVRGDHPSIPALRMMSLSSEEVGKRAEALLSQIKNVRGLLFESVPGESVIGGGAAPGVRLPTVLIVASWDGLSASELAARLRASEPPVIARVEDNKVLLDLRTVFPEQDSLLAEAFRRIAS